MILPAAKVCKYCGCWPCRCGLDPDIVTMPLFALRSVR